MSIIARLGSPGNWTAGRPRKPWRRSSHAIPCCEPRFARRRRADWNGSRRQIVLRQFMDRRPGQRSLALDATDRPFFRTGIEGLGHGGSATEFARVAGPSRRLRRQGGVPSPRRLPAKLCPCLRRQAVRRSNCRPAIRRPCTGEGRFGLTAGKYLRMLPAQLTGLSRRMEVLHAQAGSLVGTASRHIAGELPASFPDVKVGRLEAEEVRKLSAAAADCQSDRKRLAAARLLRGGR